MRLAQAWLAISQGAVTVTPPGWLCAAAGRADGDSLEPPGVRR